MTSNQGGHSVYEIVVLGNHFYAFSLICPRLGVGNLFFVPPLSM